MSERYDFIVQAKVTTQVRNGFMTKAIRGFLAERFAPVLNTPGSWKITGFNHNYVLRMPIDTPLEVVDSVLFGLAHAHLVGQESARSEVRRAMGSGS